jgi:hypothetical protein
LIELARSVAQVLTRLGELEVTLCQPLGSGTVGGVIAELSKQMDLNAHRSPHFLQFTGVILFTEIIKKKIDAELRWGRLVVAAAACCRL